MWIGVQCDGVCFVTYRATLVQARNRTVAVPNLIRNSTLYEGNVLRNRSNYFFIPFVRNQT